MTSASLTQIPDRHMNVFTAFKALANLSYWTGDQLTAAVPGVPGATAPGGIVSSPQCCSRQSSAGLGNFYFQTPDAD